MAVTAESKKPQAKKSENEVPWLQRIAWIANIFYYQCVVLIVALLFWIYATKFDINRLFTWHMMLCTAAYLPLMAVAIVSFNENNLLTLYVRRRRIYWVHGILLTLSCLLVTVGVSLEIANKNQHNKEHFKSNHAILGLTSWLIVLVSTCLGLIAANTNLVSQYVKPVLAKFIHNFLGLTAFALGNAAIILQYDHHVKPYVHNVVYHVINYLSVKIATYSAITAIQSLYYQIKSLLGK